MNCPAKTEPILPDGHNQSPNDLCSDLTTRSDLGRLANARLQRQHRLSEPDGANDTQIIPQPPASDVHEKSESKVAVGGEEKEQGDPFKSDGRPVAPDGDPDPRKNVLGRWTYKIGRILKTYVKFMGPGFMVAVVRPAIPPPTRPQPLT